MISDSQPQVSNIRADMRKEFDELVHEFLPYSDGNYIERLELAQVRARWELLHKYFSATRKTVRTSAKKQLRKAS